MPTLPVINSSVFSEQQIAEFLAAATIPVRLACNDEKGFPLVASHWFAYHDGLLYCAIHKASRFAKLLSRDPRCGFEIAGDSPPYRGVRGQGNAELISKQGEAQLKELLNRYLGGTQSALAQWLLSRGADELAVCITPTWVTSWDFTERMGK